MAMPRPTGKVKKIAEMVIPGLNRNQPSSLKKGRVKPHYKDDVEMTVVKINENLGKAPKSKKSFGI